jgi:hypothetical protein
MYWRDKLAHPIPLRNKKKNTTQKLENEARKAGI